VLYRQLLMRKPPQKRVGYIIDLAEITIPAESYASTGAVLHLRHELTLGQFWAASTSRATRPLCDNYASDKKRSLPRQIGESSGSRQAQEWHEHDERASRAAVTLEHVFLLAVEAEARKVVCRRNPPWL